MPVIEHDSQYCGYGKSKTTGNQAKIAAAACKRRTQEEIMQKRTVEEGWEVTEQITNILHLLLFHVFTFSGITRCPLMQVVRDTLGISTF